MTPISAYERLNQILDILRTDCPWDRVQTIESLRYLTIEEVYELSESILQKDNKEMQKELGDLFMHLVFYSKIAEDEGLFSQEEVLHGICDKLVSRHPHIALPNREGILQGGPENPTPEWEKVKMKEGRKSVLEGVPSSLPTLVKSVRMQEKVSGIGFDYPSQESAFDKVKEEFNELKDTIQNEESTTRKTEEFGDLLFALIKWGNKLGINADDALSLANQKFQQRFSHVEEKAFTQNKSVSDLSPDEMLSAWNEAKLIQQQ